MFATGAADLRVCNLGPARSVEERVAVCALCIHRLPEIGLVVVVEAVELEKLKIKIL